MSEASPYEASAREIANMALRRARGAARIPKELMPVVEELMVDAAHDAIEFGEAITASFPEKASSRLEHYTRGYIDGITDLQQRGGVDGDSTIS